MASVKMDDVSWEDFALRDLDHEPFRRMPDKLDLPPRHPASTSEWRNSPSYSYSNQVMAFGSIGTNPGSLARLLRQQCEQISGASAGPGAVMSASQFGEASAQVL